MVRSLDLIVLHAVLLQKLVMRLALVQVWSGTVFTVLPQRDLYWQYCWRVEKSPILALIWNHQYYDYQSQDLLRSPNTSTSALTPLFTWESLQVSRHKAIFTSHARSKQGQANLSCLHTRASGPTRRTYACRINLKLGANIPRMWFQLSSPFQHSI